MTKNQYVHIKIVIYTTDFLVTFLQVEEVNEMEKNIDFKSENNRKKYTFDPYDNTFCLTSYKHMSCTSESVIRNVMV